MIRLNIHEAKTHLSRYLSMIRKGETILLCKRNQPIAEIRPLQSRAQKRPVGLAKGQFAVPKNLNLFPKSSCKHSRVKPSEDPARHMHISVAHH